MSKPSPQAPRIFKAPTLLTTAFAERQALIKPIQDVYPEETPIDRTTLPNQMIGQDGVYRCKPMGW